MMKLHPFGGLRAIEVSNFAGIERATIDVKPGLSAFVGNNGAGKSSILQAIAYGFTGMRSRGTKEADVVRRGSKEARIVLTLDDGVEFLVRRTDGGSVSFHHGTSKIKVNHWLEHVAEVLGCSSAGLVLSMHEDGLFRLKTEDWIENFGAQWTWSGAEDVLGSAIIAVARALVEDPHGSLDPMEVYEAAGKQAHGFRKQSEAIKGRLYRLTHMEEPKAWAQRWSLEEAYERLKTEITRERKAYELIIQEREEQRLLGILEYMSKNPSRCDSCGQKVKDAKSVVDKLQQRIDQVYLQRRTKAADNARQTLSDLEGKKNAADGIMSAIADWKERLSTVDDKQDEAELLDDRVRLLKRVRTSFGPDGLAGSWTSGPMEAALLSAKGWLNQRGLAGDVSITATRKSVSLKANDFDRACLSTSERWRTDTILRLVLAASLGTASGIVDGVEILDPSTRPSMIRDLTTMATESTIFAGWTVPPHMATDSPVPLNMNIYLVDNGIVTPVVDNKTRSTA